jgi:probable F420-dependent oxidoreductase
VRLGLAVEGAIYPLDQQHRLIDLARQAEEAGFDDISIPEHVLVGNRANDQDPWSSWEPHHLDLPWDEPLVTLAAMAGATRRLRLVSAVVIAPLRPAGLLAKMVASLHALSQGRFVLGISPSWHRQEYEALGVSFERRGQILEDAIGACRALWEGAPASFHSATVNFEGMYCQPRPAPGERIPVWFTGKFTPRLVRRIVTLGDGWMPFGAYGMTLEQKAAAIRQLRERFSAAGRDPDSLEISDSLPPVEGSITRSLEQLPAMLEAGMTTVRIPLRRLVTSPDQVPGVLEEAVSRFRQVAGSHPTGRSPAAR